MEISEFTESKNDGACDTYIQPKDSKNEFVIVCPKCGHKSIMNDDNSYSCPQCHNVFYTEHFLLY